MRLDDGKTQAWLILSGCAVISATALTLAAPYLWSALTEPLKAGLREAERDALARQANRTREPSPDDPAWVRHEGEAPVRTVNQEHWITTADYPLEAIRAAREGRVRIAARFDARGMPVACSTVISSGDRTLDDAACQAVMARGLLPPLPPNEAGLREIRRNIVWQLPEDLQVMRTEIHDQ